MAESWRFIYVSFGSDPYRIIRLVAFFVAGLVVAVGAALIYSLHVASAGHVTGQPPEVSRAAPEPEPASVPELPQAVDVNRSGVPNGAFDDGQEPRAALPVSAPEQKTLHNTLRVARHIAGNLLPPPVLVRSDEPEIGDLKRASAVAAPVTRSIVNMPTRQPHVATFDSGTAVTIRLGETLSSGYDRRGETFRGTLETPLVANGFVIADRGSAAVGRVLYVHKARLIGSASELRLILTGINTTDGQFVAIDTHPWDEKGGRMHLGNPAKMAVGAVAEVVSDAAKVAHFDGSGPNLGKVTNQKVVTLPKDARLTFRLAIPVTITEKIASR